MRFIPRGDSSAARKGIDAVTGTESHEYRGRDDTYTSRTPANASVDDKHATGSASSAAARPAGNVEQFKDSFTKFAELHTWCSAGWSKTRRRSKPRSLRAGAPGERVLNRAQARPTSRSRSGGSRRS